MKRTGRGDLSPYIARQQLGADLDHEAPNAVENSGITQQNLGIAQMGWNIVGTPIGPQPGQPTTVSAPQVAGIPLMTLLLVLGGGYIAYRIFSKR